MCSSPCLNPANGEWVPHGQSCDADGNLLLCDNGDLTVSECSGAFECLSLGDFAYCSSCGDVGLEGECTDDNRVQYCDVSDLTAAVPVDISCEEEAPGSECGYDDDGYAVCSTCGDLGEVGECTDDNRLRYCDTMGSVHEIVEVDCNAAADGSVCGFGARHPTTTALWETCDDLSMYNGYFRRSLLFNEPLVGSACDDGDDTTNGDIPG